MKLIPNEIYHVFNRGNNRQPIFIDLDNYYYFLGKVKEYLVPNCDILSFTLMPNHFHFQITANNISNRPFKKKRRSKNKKWKRAPIKLTNFSWALQQLLSSYTRGMNQRYNRTGSLFQQNTRKKKTSSEFFTDDYSLWCFIYIHNNAQTAGLVNSPEDYLFTSYRDYLENRSDSICNLERGKTMLSFDLNDLFGFKSLEVPPEVITKMLK